MYLPADFTKLNGSGGESIYGGPFPDEDLSRPLDSKGCVFVYLSENELRHIWTLQPIVHGQQRTIYQQQPIFYYIEGVPSSEW
jgi:hypothetical protein